MDPISNSAPTAAGQHQPGGLPPAAAHLPGVRGPDAAPPCAEAVPEALHQHLADQAGWADGHGQRQPVWAATSAQSGLGLSQGLAILIWTFAGPQLEPVGLCCFRWVGKMLRADSAGCMDPDSLLSSCK